jgi:hypothetical protein
MPTNRDAVADSDQQSASLAPFVAVCRRSGEDPREAER